MNVLKDNLILDLKLRRAVKLLKRYSKGFAQPVCAMDLDEINKHLTETAYFLEEMERWYNAWQ